MSKLDQTVVFTLLSIAYLFIQTCIFMLLTKDMNISSDMGIAFNIILWVSTMFMAFRLFRKV